MKKVFYVFGLVVLVCVICASAACGALGEKKDANISSGNEQTDDSYFYFTRLENGTYAVAAKSADLPKKTIIPAMHEGMPVTEISEEAFRERGLLEEIVIPNSVALINRKAFYKCIGLTSIIIPEGVTVIPHQCFYMSGLESVTIPKSVTSIEYSAFNGCSRLSTITFKGTKEEWLSIEKNEEGWAENTGDYVVSCLDGTLLKESYMD